jgi:uncharacterized membrane protein
MAMAFGPVQLLALGFDGPDFQSAVLAEFERLGASDAVRVVDLLVVHKDADGVVERVPASELAAGAARGSGAVVEALIGLARSDTESAPLLTEDEFWSLDEAIPNDSAAVLVLVEHQWAIGALAAIRAAGGVAVADAWVHPADLIAAGLIDAEGAALPDR